MMVLPAGPAKCYPRRIPPVPDAETGNREIRRIRDSMEAFLSSSFVLNDQERITLVVAARIIGLRPSRIGAEHLEQLANRFLNTALRCEAVGLSENSSPQAKRTNLRAMELAFYRAVQIEQLWWSVQRARITT